MKCKRESHQFSVSFTYNNMRVNLVNVRSIRKRDGRLRFHGESEGGKLTKFYYKQDEVKRLTVKL